MTLEECAQALGVGTHTRGEDFGKSGRYAPLMPRPRLDIAHECLAKLPEEVCPRYVLEWRYGNNWYVYFLPYTDNWSFNGTFEQALVALCERYLQEKP